jgi:hypothetical protein
MCDVLATASGIPTAPVHRVYQVSGSAAEAHRSPAPLTAMVLPLASPSVEFSEIYDEIYDDIFYLA